MSAGTLIGRSRREALRFAADRLRERAEMIRYTSADTKAGRARRAAYTELELELRRRAVADQPGEGS